MERAGKLLVFTSPTLQEGKTTTIVNVALTMAQNGQRTLLVGANLRRPSIHRYFGIEREPGLSDILVGNAPWRDCIRTVADILMGRFEMEDIMAAPGLDNLHIIESGPSSPPPFGAPLHAGAWRVPAARCEEYDVVAHRYAAGPSRHRFGRGRRPLRRCHPRVPAGKVGRLVLKRAKAHLESTRASVWGVVLNDVQSEIAGYTYAHYYTHYYGEEAGARPPGRGSRLWGFLRRRKTPPTAMPPLGAGTTDDGAETVPAESDESSALRSRRRSRDILGGVGIVLLLLAGILGVTAWHRGWFASDGRPWNLAQRPSELPAPRPEGAAATSPEGAATSPEGAAAPAAPASTAVGVDPAPVAPPAPLSSSPVPCRPSDTPSRETAAARRRLGTRLQEGPSVTHGRDSPSISAPSSRAPRPRRRSSPQPGATIRCRSVTAGAAPTRSTIGARSARGSAVLRAPAGDSRRRVIGGARPSA